MKIIKISFDDIIINPKESAKIISDACKRGKYYVSGICELSEAVAVILLPGEDSESDYVFAKFAEDDDESKIAEIHDHYRGGLDLIGTFCIDDQFWGLFKNRRK